MHSDEEPDRHYNGRVFKTVRRLAEWLRRYRHQTTNLEQIVVLLSVMALVACERNRLAPPVALSIIFVAVGVRGAWAAAMDGIKTCLTTQLSGFCMGLAIAGIAGLLLSKSYPQPDISRFAFELSYVAMFIAVCTHWYVGLLVDVAMTREDQWQKGYVWRRQKVAAVQRWLRRG